MDFPFHIVNGCWVQGRMRQTPCCPTAESCLTPGRHPCFCAGTSREGAAEEWCVWVCCLGSWPGAAEPCRQAVFRDLWSLWASHKRYLLYTFCELFLGLVFFFVYWGSKIFWVAHNWSAGLFLENCYWSLCMRAKFPFNFSKEGTNWGKGSPESWN